jgi:hypothetical protein
MKIAAICLFGFALALVQGQEPPKAPSAQGQGVPNVPVTLEARTQSLAKLLEGLSEDVGIRLEADATTARELVVVRVRDVPLPTLMAKLAETIDAEWVERGGRHTLTRPAARAQAQVRKEERQRLESLAKRLEEISLGHARQGALDEGAAERLALRIADLAQTGVRGTYRDIRSLSELTPSSRLIARLLPKVGPVEMAAIPAGRRVVFSTSPNRMQRALPREALDEVLTFAREQNLLASALEGRLAPRNSAQGSYLPYDLDNASTIDAPPAKVLLAVHHTERDSYQAEVVVADESGKILARHQRSVQTSFEDFASTIASAPTGDNERAVELQEDGRLFADWIKHAARGLPNTPKPAGRLREILLHPERHELLELVLPDILLAFARSRDHHLIAHVDDLSFMMGSIFATEGATPTAAIHVLTQEGNLDLQTEDGWSLLRQRRPAYEREMRTDRAVLGRLLRDVVTQEKITIDLMARNLHLLPPLEEITLSVWLAMMLGGREIEEYMQKDGRSALKVYAMLDREQRSALGAGKALEMRTLSSAQQAVIADMAFNRRAMTYGNVSPMFGSPRNALTSEPTEAMPNGLPGGATLSGSISTEATVIGIREGVRKTYTVQSMAFEEFRRERPGFLGGPEPGARFTQFLTGSWTRIGFHVRYTEILSHRLELTQHDEDEGGRSVPYDRLPEEFRAAVTKQLELYRFQNKDR